MMLPPDEYLKLIGARIRVVSGSALVFAAMLSILLCAAPTRAEGIGGRTPAPKASRSPDTFITRSKDLPGPDGRADSPLRDPSDLQGELADLKARSLAYARIQSARMDQSMLHIIDGRFTRDLSPGDTVTFSARVKDGGLADGYLQNHKDLRDGLLNELGVPPEEFQELESMVKDCASGQEIKQKRPKVEFRGSEGRDLVVDVPPPPALMRESAGRTGRAVISSPDSCQKNRKRFEQLLHEFETRFRRSPVLPAGAPLYFLAYRVDPKGKRTLVWTSDPVVLEPGAAGVIESSPWRIPGEGDYQVTFMGISPSLGVRASIRSPLPAHFEMAGFVLDVVKYEVNAGPGLAGVAKTVWKGDNSQGQLMVEFENVRVPETRSANPSVTAGKARLKSGEGHPLDLFGRKILLRSLFLGPQHAVADLEYRFETGPGEAYPPVVFKDVVVSEGGEFIAEKRLEHSRRPIRLGDIDLDLAGARIILDASLRSGSPKVFRDASWVGIALANGVLRTRIRPSSPSKPDRDLFHVENLDTAFLYGRFTTLTINSRGLIDSEKLKVVTADEAGAAFGKAVESTVRLLSPMGFSLRLEGGLFGLIDGAVSSLDLAGYLVLPNDYRAPPVYFRHLRRNQDPSSGFETEEITRDLPDIRLGGFTYRPGKARLKIPAILELGLPRRTPPPIKVPVWPQDREEIQSWQTSLENRLMDLHHGLILSGGSLVVPWAEAPPPPASRRESDASGGSRVPSTIVKGQKPVWPWEKGRVSPERPEIPGKDVPSRHVGPGRWLDVFPGIVLPLQGGAFVLESSGTSGQWLVTKDPRYRKIGEFTAELDGVHIHFRRSAMTSSLVQGRLLIPYPARVEIPFDGTLTHQAEVMVAADGLRPPDLAEGWKLDYWKMRLFPASKFRRPGKGIDKPSLRPGSDPKSLPPHLVPIRRPMVFAHDRILLTDADMDLDVSDEFGGVEFTRRDGGHPFTVSLEILPNGRIDHVSVSPSAAGGILFLGIPFEPGSDEIEVRRYVGSHVPPEKTEPPTPLWLVKLEGGILFNLFGSRRVRICHTAMGARLPFVEPTAVDENGRPTPVFADSTGAVLIDARLKFVNTFGAPDTVVENRFPPRPSDAARPYDSHEEAREEHSPFKAFVGEGRIHILNALSINGVAEAGQRRNAQSQLRTYEKIGVGGGVDILRGVLAGLHGMETVARLGGAVVEITTGAEGLGAEVIHVASDAVAFTSSVVTTVLALAGAAASGGGAASLSAEEIRNVVGNGLTLSASTVDLLKAIYLQRPFYDPSNAEDPSRDPPYVALEIADILLVAANLGVEFDDMEPEEVAQVLLQAIDVAIPILEAMKTGNAVTDQKVKLALSITHAIVRAARALVERGAISETEAWLLARDVVTAAKLFQELPEIKGSPEFDALPLALAIAEVSVDVGSSLRTGQGDVNLANLVDLFDRLLGIVCEDIAILEPLFEAPGFPGRDVYSVLSISRALFSRINDPEFLTGALPPEEVIPRVALPLLDWLIDGNSQTTCGGRLDYGPYDAEVKALLRVARQGLRGVVLGSSLAGEETRITEVEVFEWAASTVLESAVALNTLQPGSVDEQVVDSLVEFRDAFASVDSSGPPIRRVLELTDALMPKIREAAALTPDPTAPLIVDAVGAVVRGLIPVAGEDPGDIRTWLEGSRQVVNEIRRLPLHRDVIAGLTMMALALDMAQAGTGEVIYPKRLIHSAKGIVDILRQLHGSEPLDTPTTVAYAGSFRDGPAILPAAVDAGPTLAMISAMLGALEGAVGVDRISLAALSNIITSAVLALYPQQSLSPRGRAGELLPAAAFTGFDEAMELLVASLQVLPALNVTRPASEAFTQVLTDLLKSEAETTQDPEVRLAILAARAALIQPPTLVQGSAIAQRGELIDSVRSVDNEGGSIMLHRYLDPSENKHTWFLETNFPEGHSRCAGGLREVYYWRAGTWDVPTQFRDVLYPPTLPEDLLDFYERLRALSGVTSAPGVMIYRDTSGREVDFQRPRNADGGFILLEDNRIFQTARITEPIGYGPFIPMRKVEISDVPAPCRTADEIQGLLLEAKWRDESAKRNYTYTYNPEQSRLRADFTDYAGAYEIRAVGNERFASVGGIPTGGRLLVYHGSPPAPDRWVLDYESGRGYILVLDGSNYDRIEVDPNLAVSAADQIPKDGRLLERRIFFADGRSWLYHPKKHALLTFPCGEWELYSIQDLPDGSQTPNPSQELPVGLVKALGSPDGTVSDRDDNSLHPRTMTEFGIRDEGGLVTVSLPDGTLVVYSGFGSTIILPDTERESEHAGDCASSRREAGWVQRIEPPDENCSRKETLLDPDSAAFSQIKECGGQKKKATVSPDGKGQITIGFDPEDGQPPCEAGKIRMNFAYSKSEPAVRIVDPKPVSASGEGDPLLLRKKRLFLATYETERQKLALNPTADGIIHLLDLVDRAGQLGWTFPELDMNARATSGVHLNRLMEEELRKIATVMGLKRLVEEERQEGMLDFEAVRQWILDLSPDNPIRQLLISVGIIEEEAPNPEIIQEWVIALPPDNPIRRLLVYMGIADRYGIELTQKAPAILAYSLRHENEDPHPLTVLLESINADRRARPGDVFRRFMARGAYTFAKQLIKGEFNAFPEGCFEVLELVRPVIDEFKSVILNGIENAPAGEVLNEYRECVDAVAFLAFTGTENDPILSQCQNEVADRAPDLAGSQGDLLKSRIRARAPLGEIYEAARGCLNLSALLQLHGIEIQEDDQAAQNAIDGCDLRNASEKVIDEYAQQVIGLLNTQPDWKDVRQALQTVMEEVNLCEERGQGEVCSIPTEQLLPACEYVAEGAKSEYRNVLPGGDSTRIAEATQEALSAMRLMSELCNFVDGDFREDVRPHTEDAINHAKQRLLGALNRRPHSWREVETAIEGIRSVGRGAASMGLSSFPSGIDGEILGLFQQTVPAEPTPDFRPDASLPPLDPESGRFVEELPLQYHRFLVNTWVLQGFDSRSEAASFTSSLTDQINDSGLSSHLEALESFLRFVNAVVELQPPYPVDTSSDPFQILREQLRSKHSRMVATFARQVPDAAPESPAGAGPARFAVLTLAAGPVVTVSGIADTAGGAESGDVDADLSRVGVVASVYPDSLDGAFEQSFLPTLDTIRIQGGADRFQVAADFLAPVLERSGHPLRIAHRLASRITSPDTADDFNLRVNVILELSGYLADKLLGTGETEPAVSMAGVSETGSMRNPQALLAGLMSLALPSPGFTPGQQLAAQLKELLGGFTSGNPMLRAGLNLTGAAVDGALAAYAPAAQAQQPNWLDVLESAATSLEPLHSPDAPLEDFWIGLSARFIGLGIDVYKQNRTGNDAAVVGLDLAVSMLDYPDIKAALDAMPEPGRSLMHVWKEIMSNTLDNVALGDPLDIALARVMGHAVFRDVPPPYGPLGADVADWALDFARDNNPVFGSLLEGDTAGTQRDSGALLDAFLSARGIPTLTCLLQEHLNVFVPPAPVLIPIVGAKELLAHSGELATGSDLWAAAMLDVGAGMINLWLSGAETSACPSPSGLSRQDVPLAALTRALKELDTSDPRAGFELLGRFGLAAVDAVAPGSPLARALYTLWYGRETSPAPSEPYVGLGSALRGDVTDYFEFGLEVPVIAGNIVAILSEDPNLNKMMRLLGGACEPNDLLGPDRCGSTVPNLLLSVLGDARKGIVPGLSDAQHETHPQWGYLKTLPVLGPGESLLPDLSRVQDQEAWNQTVAAVTNLEAHVNRARRAGAGVTDLARMAVRVMASLPQLSTGGPTAQQILDQSLFAPQTGGETFSGVGGGLMREWAPGSSADDADLYFEMVGQFAVPALVKTAAQLTYTTEGTDWLLMLRAAGNYPDLNSIGRKIGVDLPMNEIASSFIGNAEAHLTGWLGVVDDSPYVQLYSAAALEWGAIPLGRLILSGYMKDFRGDNPLETASNIDVGMCGQVDQQFSPFILAGVGATSRLGGYFFKEGLTGGLGMKLGVEGQLAVSFAPVAGITLGLEAGGSGSGGVDPASDTMGFEVSQCARPYVGGYFFGLRLQDLDVPVETQLFGEADWGKANAEFGYKFRFQIAEDYYQTMFDNLNCFDPIQAPLCAVLSGAEAIGLDTLGAWMVLTNKGFYFGLGSFPNRDDTVPGFAFSSSSGEFGPIGLHSAGAWGGWSRSVYDLCSGNMCQGRDAAPSGAPVRPEPPY
ncbi:MAG: hypothetical protein HY788_02590 [Deltaproteobacteria bacterium]|nr:hypothetical protein [Deltaproteobacteria bacterium]